MSELGELTNEFVGGSFFAFVFAGTLYMQQVLHYSALQTGGAWAAASVTSMALTGISQLLVTRVTRLATSDSVAGRTPDRPVAATRSWTL